MSNEVYVLLKNEPTSRSPTPTTWKRALCSFLTRGGPRTGLSPYQLPLAGHPWHRLQGSGSGESVRYQALQLALTEIRAEEAARRPEPDRDDVVSPKGQSIRSDQGFLRSAP